MLKAKMEEAVKKKKRMETEEEEGETDEENDEIEEDVVVHLQLTQHVPEPAQDLTLQVGRTSTRHFPCPSISVVVLAPQLVLLPLPFN